MPRPVCVPCAVEMLPTRNGILVHLTSDDGEGGRHPFQIWSGDLWGCSRCAAEVVTGWGVEPMATSGKPGDNFDRLLPLVTVTVHGR